MDGSLATGAGWIAPERTPEYVELWRAVMQRKWAILALATGCTALAWFTLQQIRPVYRSTATVLIDPAPTKVITQFEDVVGGVSANRESLQTQAEIMKGREVIERVVTRLKLAEHREFDPRQQTASGWRQLVIEYLPSLGELVDAQPVEFDDASAKDKAIRAVAERLRIEPIRLSQLVRVRFDSNDPNTAAAVANAVAEAYIAHEKETRQSITAGAGDWIRERMVELKKKLDKSEQALQSYREKEGLLDSKTTVLGGNGRQLDELTNRLVEAGVQRALAEQAYRQVKAGEGSLESVPAVVRNPAVQTAKAVENELTKRLAEVSQRYGPEHPRNIAAATELKTAQLNTQKEIRAVVDSLVREYQSAVSTEKSIESQLRESKGTIQTLNRKEIQLSALEREAATNRQIYDAFLTRYGETTATRDAQQATARIVDRATTPLSPAYPQKAPVLGFALGGGLILGIVASMVLSRLNNSVRTSSDIETRLQYPFLSALPVLTFSQKRGAGKMLLEQPDSLYAEGVRTATTGIMLSSIDSPKKVLAVTSSLPGEGKTTTAVNLAVALSRTRSTVLMEADLRRPTLLKTLGVNSAVFGVADCLAGECAVEAALIDVEGTSLRVLPCGVPPPDPLSLVSSLAFKQLIEALHQQFEVVIIDCPPVQVVSDALMIGAGVTGVIYVIKADDTPIATARIGLRRLKEAGAHTIGVILNQHNHRRAYKYYGERYGYGKYSYKGYGYSTKAGGTSASTRASS